ncbi:hypothetical protein BDQ12DRAFT_680807 [Crucibulum laeve]|uniref:LsmAD domain-containing protein n=1 Tax=Crucibulum laeve TaxID=68775 RepID=A0A5C3M7G4_9AGAR|nr:hypothetical protein BDQ12DRAFT_680807 [Crucibulum laeve]
MATTARQTKPARKGAPEPARRPQGAWSGARASPTFSPSTPSPRPQSNAPAPNAFPPLGQTNGAPRDRILQALSGLTGTTITLTTKTAQRYEGVVASTSGEGDTTGVSLKDVKEITNPGAPLKDLLFIASTNIDSYASGPADAKPTTTNGDSFRTDTDISQKKLGGRERELQAWVPTSDTSLGGSGGGDEETFGGIGTGNTSWDQFAANEQMFGVKTSFDEDVYTTKLDRTAADFKERERKAQKIANEILGTSSNNPHIAEERGQHIDDSGANEEDKYGAVVRGQNAYVPPGARKGGPLSPPLGGSATISATNSAATRSSPDVPKVAVNGPDGTAVVMSQGQSPVSSKAPSPAPAGNKPPADPLPAFRDFVTNEKQRLTQKRQALVKSEMEKRMADLVKFSQSFKLNKPIPEDLVPILAKDEDKQRAIKEKASKDASSSQARAIGASTPATASRGIVPGAKISEAPRTKQTTGVPTSKPTQTPASAAQKPSAPAPAVTQQPKTAAPADKKQSNSIYIQPIPPFKGSKPTRQAGAAAASAAAGVGSANRTTVVAAAAPTAASNPAVAPSVNTNTPAVSGPVSPSVNNKLNVNASSFRPTSKPPASASTNGTASASASVSPKPRDSSTSSAPNPFFGTRPMKKIAPVHIKDDFNPFKHNKVVDASQVAPTWPYNGKRYMSLFPQPQPQQHPSHMGPPGPPPMPPPSYEEDSAAQAAARGYVYAYPPYGYHGQPMMPGMAPPGPPGAYMPGPFMQPMPYPPGMPPPNAMYSPAMGQMPPPQAYMQPPPPGPYPPPNGAGPRPSMPPTPIPAHAHPYYHQSPQLQHAVPYPMMMPPPPNVPPHGYEGGPPPPVQMGGHA